MKRFFALWLACMLLMAGTALGEGIDYDAMTLEEVKAIADDAYAYYREMTDVSRQMKTVTETLLMEALEIYFEGCTVSKPLLGFDTTRARDVYTIEDSVKVKGDDGKTTHEVHAVFVKRENVTLQELVVDGKHVEPGSAAVTVLQEEAESTNKVNYNDYGEQLSLIETDGVCVLKYKITSQMTNKMTIRQNYYTVANFILDGGGDRYDEIQYWAVADMRDGSESKVISFTVPKKTIEAVKAGKLVAIELGDYVDDLWVLQSLTK